MLFFDCLQRIALHHIMMMFVILSSFTDASKSTSPAIRYVLVLWRMKKNKQTYRMELNNCRNSCKCWRAGRKPKDLDPFCNT